MAKRIRGKKLIRLSAARARIRFGYASVLEVCCSGFVAGAIVFLISVAVYFPASMIRVQTTVREVVIEESGTLAEFFSMRILDEMTLAAAIVNVSVILAVFGAVGAAAGMILRCGIRREPSDSFFTKKIRAPLEVLPFVALFGYAGVLSATLPVVYVAAAFVAAFLWRFWYNIILSAVSSLDVDRFMPRPVRKK